MRNLGNGCSFQIIVDMRGFSDSGNKLYNKVRYKKFDLSNYIRTLVKNVYVIISFFIIINLFLISYL